MNTGSHFGQRVVARFLDGRVLKGTTQDFGPLKPAFHLFPEGDPQAKALSIPTSALKALFFVKSWSGDPSRDDAYDFDAMSGQGRRIRVTFEDDEVVEGFTIGFARDKQGFFVIPADPGSNNTRIFVVAAAAKRVEFLPVADRNAGLA